MARSAKSPAVSTASDLPAEISAWLSDPGFTPGAKHLSKLFAALAAAEREDARKLERVLGRAGEAAGRIALGRLTEADARERARLYALLGRVANGSSEAEFRSALLAGLSMIQHPSRRNFPAHALRAKYRSLRGQQPITRAPVGLPNSPPSSRSLSTPTAGW